MRKLRLVTGFGLPVAVVTLLNLLAGASDRTIEPLPALIPKGNNAAIIGLTDDQRNQLRSLSHSFQNEIKPPLSQKFEKEAELLSLWSQTRPNLQRIKSLRIEIQGLERQLAVKYRGYPLAVRKILTPGQLSVPGIPARQEK